ncbi:DUF4283 domain-containing protein, partial [Cephalotus follicularis]
LLNSTIRALWKPVHSLRIKDIEKNIFLFMFNNSDDRKRVIRSSPWLFDKSIFLMEAVDKEIHPTKIRINKVSLWVSKEVGEVIGQGIDGFEEVMRVNGRGIDGQYVLIRVLWM